MKKFLSLVLLATFILNPLSVFASENFYLFGLRLQDNDYDIIPKLEKKFGVYVPIVSIIYDDFNRGEQEKLIKTFKNLGKDRIYHIDINPFGYSLSELMKDPKHKGWEEKYKSLFKIIKKLDVKVIFRFLHEMNGGWYSWSSDPASFPIFWKMVWNWSRDEGLDRSNILFDFSINSQDLPAIPGAIINQGTPVITCNQKQKEETGCLTFEDYYPGDDYVDIIGVTIYNWGKGARSESWANWRTPMEVINEPGYWTLNRMKKIGKPIFIDESGTTSIYYKEKYDPKKAIEIYNKNHFGILEEYPANGTLEKNIWLNQLHNLLLDPSIIGGIYFNADVTKGLTDRSQIGELDWTAIDSEKNFVYPAILDIFNDYKIIKDPSIYFEIPKKIIDSKKWITEEEMIELHGIISSLFEFKNGNILTSENFLGNNKTTKYQYYLEKKLEKDPYLCYLIKEKFDKIE
ncbi:hypothetical protein KAZ01_00005, partial [Candidatus Gracilibacteria bacterium]|nr:hypothetical protein [Candidatus Gracilibacteria bacterium]